MGYYTGKKKTFENTAVIVFVYLKDVLPELVVPKVVIHVKRVGSSEILFSQVVKDVRLF